MASSSPKDGYPPIGELPNKNIDTGMGIERVAYLLQGVDNVYETDLVRPVIARAEELSGRRYGADLTDDVRFRVIADHARSGVMIIGDGVTPSNEGRGYVLRRLLRRIVRSSRLLGVHEPVLGSFAEVVRDAMGPAYPELETDFERISAVVRAEEEAFLATLSTGSRIFDTAVAATKAAGGVQLAGDKAFQLHDTYGFPIDLTLEMAAEAGLSVDEAGFRTLMAEQRARAKRRRRRPQDRPRRRRGVPRGARQLRRLGVPRLHRPHRRGPGRRAARRPHGGAGGRAGQRRRGRARPHPVLRRGRRPAGRHRVDHR